MVVPGYTINPPQSPCNPETIFLYLRNLIPQEEEILLRQERIPGIDARPTPVETWTPWAEKESLIAEDLDLHPLRPKRTDKGAKGENGPRGRLYSYPIPASEKTIEIRGFWPYTAKA